MSLDRPIRSVAVIGAGTMGAQIAAHVANAGIPSLLLDVTAQLAADGLKRAVALRPDPFFTRQAASLITTGGLDRDAGRLADADWIVEAVVERLDVKQELFARVERERRPESIVSSNTSGIPIAALAEGRGIEFRRHFLGTHFFNPPRYLKLLEVIPTPDTDPAIVESLARFADYHLGKGVVIANDTPGFIANRIGLFGVAESLRVLESGDYTIEEIDAITGAPLGRPKSATFRTMDVAGIDILAHVARDLSERLPDERSKRVFSLSPVVQTLVDRGSVGAKANEGFYKRVGSDILTLDLATLAYREAEPARLTSLDSVRGIEEVGSRIRTLFLGSDKVGAFLRATLGTTLLYAAEVALVVARSIDDVDRAMRWGFGWELGPFEIWDAIGIGRVIDATRPEVIPPLVAAQIAAGRDTFRDQPLPPPAPDLQILKAAKDHQMVLHRNPAASLVDLGDGVLAVELHSKLNVIGGDTVAMLHAGLKEAAAHFEALVVTSDAPDFSAGANLMLVLIEAQEGNWDEIDLMVRTFQQAMLALRYSEVPVVVAPAGRALGGGCEITLHADRVQAAAETYLGLVEVGVGLIPAGGGTKEMLVRAAYGLAGTAADALATAQIAFETIAFAKASSSAADARQLGYLGDADSITMNRDRLVADAKAVAKARARAGYQRPTPPSIAVGGERVEAALKLGVHLAWRAGRITEHDALIGRTLAHVVAGGSLPHASTLSEGHLLDLEREAFLKLCGEPKTLARIQYTLKTGRPLRN